MVSFVLLLPGLSWFTRGLCLFSGIDDELSVGILRFLLFIVITVRVS